MPQQPVDSTTPKYVTWRYSDRTYSKVHLLDSSGQPLCGRTPGREVGRPKPPIPESALCEDCAKHHA